MLLYLKDALSLLLLHYCVEYDFSENAIRITIKINKYE